MLFEELGLRYIGPIDGHDIAILRKYLRMVQNANEPVLLHVVTEKGHGFKPAEDDPVFFHTPPRITNDPAAATSGSPSPPPYTTIARDAIYERMRIDERVTVLTAAMCQGTKLEPIREDFPNRFFDTGICEGHAVAFAAGQAKAGLRPIVNIYSTFLQRSYDQIFQEVALQDLPVVFTLDRAGLTGPDGPTHHGVFDLAYLRVFPNMVVMAPGDGHDLKNMVAFATQLSGPCSMRYPKATATMVAVDSHQSRAPIVLGKAEMLRQGADGTILCCGTQLSECLSAAERMSGDGIELTVVNARFVKPLDRELVLELLRSSPFVVTLEEASLAGGFGAAVLEVAADAGVTATHVKRLGVPDQFIEHGERAELLADLGLDAIGITRACRSAMERTESVGG